MKTKSGQVSIPNSDYNAVQGGQSRSSSKTPRNHPSILSSVLWDVLCAQVQDTKTTQQPEHLLLQLL